MKQYKNKRRGDVMAKKSTNQNLLVWGGLTVLAFFLLSGKFNGFSPNNAMNTYELEEIFGNSDDNTYDNPIRAPITGAYIKAPRGSSASFDDENGTTHTYDLLAFAKTKDNASDTCVNIDGLNERVAATFSFYDYGPFGGKYGRGHPGTVNGTETCLSGTTLLEMFCTKDLSSQYLPVTVAYENRTKQLNSGWVVAVKIDCSKYGFTCQTRGKGGFCG